MRTVDNPFKKFTRKRQDNEKIFRGERESREFISRNKNSKHYNVDFKLDKAGVTEDEVSARLLLRDANTGEYAVKERVKLPIQDGRVAMSSQQFIEANEKFFNKVAKKLKVEDPFVKDMLYQDNAKKMLSDMNKVVGEHIENNKGNKPKSPRQERSKSLNYDFHMKW